MKKIIYWTLCLALLTNLVIAGDKSYKWVDENGIVHYGDRVPPEYAQQRREELNKQGMTVGVTNAPKTKEQLAAEAQQARIDAEERRKREEQMNYDRILLSSYSSDEDLQKVYNGKIESIEGIIKITETNINITRQALADLEKQLTIEGLGGKKAKKTTPKKIAEAKELIAKNEAYIANKRQEQEKLRIQLNADLKRYRELTGVPNIENKANEITTVAKNITVDKASIDKKSAVVECKDSAACIKAWSMAKLYIKANANTRLKEVTDTSLITGEPPRPNTIGLSITRFTHQSGERLVMEIICHNSPEGEQYCLSSPVQAIRNGFKGYVEGN